MLNYGNQKRVNTAVFITKKTSLLWLSFKTTQTILIHALNLCLATANGLKFSNTVSLLLVNFRASFSVFNTAIEAGYAYDKYVIENSLEHIANGIGKLHSFLKDNQ